MRRADRLFDLIQILRDGRVHRAEDLAERLSVSVRTVYRDMETLAGSGVAVAGERGLGYMMTAPITLPPVNLTLTELEALHLGLAAVAEAADEELSRAARSLSSKIDAALPEDRAARPADWGLGIHPFADQAAGFRFMPPLRAAIREQRKVRLVQVAADGTRTHRVVRPLQLDFWGRVWTVTVWCELRQDFRTFRVDRIAALETLPDRFTDEVGKSLMDYVERQKAREAGR